MGGDDWLFGGFGDDNIVGLTGNDLLLGEAGDDVLWGTVGNDVLNGGSDNDTYSFADWLGLSLVVDYTIIDASGIDTLDFSEMSTGITVDLRAFGRQSLSAPSDVTVELPFNAIENVVGTDFDDVIRGNRLANELSGLGGNDALEGRGGDDTLRGGGGNDRLLNSDAADLLFSGLGFDTFDEFEEGTFPLPPRPRYLDWGRI